MTEADPPNTSDDHHHREDENGDRADARSRRGLRDWLGINASTLSLLGTILLVTAATELWAPLVPQYLKNLQTKAGGGTGEGGGIITILLVGAYGFYRDALEAINYYLGGAIGGYLNTRRALLLFNFLPIVGLVILATWDSTVAVFVAIPFIFAWNTIAGPATVTIVGDALPPDRRTMAFSLQHIFRRVARIGAYALAAPFVWTLGKEGGVRANAAIAIVFVIGAALLQWKFMKTASRDKKMVLRKPRHLFRRFDPNLKRLLAADIAARWAEGMIEPFVILFCIPIIEAEHGQATVIYQSVLLSIMAATSMACYLIIGPLASREGLAKKPYIGLTFFFFAIFPISLIVLGEAFGTIGLAFAFAIGGMREIGEPARKAMIADLVPPDVKTQAIGLYWSARSVAVMLAAPVAAGLWIAGNNFREGFGPTLAFSIATLLGVIGASVFFVRFGKIDNEATTFDSK